MEIGLGKRSIIVVEDDAEDRQMIEEAAREAGISIPLVCLKNGDLLLDLLFPAGGGVPPDAYSLPLLIFLDLNLPLAGGRKVLEKIKSDPQYKKIPVVVFTTSAVKEEIAWAYATGANSFILKPFSYNELIEIMRLIKQYWFETVELPG
jgi:CheY-like chemotaxis protein